MKTVEKYVSFAEHLFENRNVHKYGAMLIKHGVKGAAKKINPVTIYFDAALSVLDACSSYLTYAKEREITKQIEAENRAIKTMLANELAIIKAGFDTQLSEGKARIKHIENLLAEGKLKTINANNQIKKVLKITNNLQKGLKKEREQGINFEQLIKLQSELDHMIRACIMLINSQFDNE